MAKKEENRRPTMHGPADYRIRVQGRLDSSWSDRMAGMQIIESCDANGEPETVLEGWLTDQAALSGVLNTIYELHLPVLSVECLSGGTGPDATPESHSKHRTCE
jgi:hypothetical protein